MKPVVVMFVSAIVNAILTPVIAIPVIVMMSINTDTCDSDCTEGCDM